MSEFLDKINWHIEDCEKALPDVPKWELEWLEGRLSGLQSAKSIYQTYEEVDDVE